MNASAWSNRRRLVARGIRWNTSDQLFELDRTSGAMPAEGLECFLADPERRELAGGAAHGSASRFARAW